MYHNIEAALCCFNMETSFIALLCRSTVDLYSKLIMFLYGTNEHLDTVELSCLGKGSSVVRVEL